MPWQLDLVNGMPATLSGPLFCLTHVFPYNIIRDKVYLVYYRPYEVTNRVEEAVA